MKNLYINTQINDFVFSKDKPLQVVATPEFYVGDVKDYAIYFVNSDKAYDNVSGSVVKVALGAPRKGPYSGIFKLTIGGYSGSFEYNSIPSDIIAELNNNGIEAEIHGRDGAFDLNLLNTTASVSVDISNLQPACSGYVNNYTGSAYQIRMVPKPYGYLEGIANISSGSSVIGFSGSFNLKTIEAASGVGSRNVAALIEIEKDERTVIQKETKLINEIINEALNDFNNVELPHFLTTAAVDGKLDISAYQIDSASFNNSINSKLDISAYQVDSGSFNSNISLKLDESAYNTFTSSFYQAFNLSTSVIYDRGDVASIAFDNRYLYDNAGLISIDYSNRSAYDYAGLQSLDFANRVLYDVNTIPSIDYNTRILSDGYGNQVLSFSDAEDSNATLSSATLGGVYHGYAISAGANACWIPSIGQFVEYTGQAAIIDLNNNFLQSYSATTDGFTPSLNWAQRIAYGSDGVTSIHYGERYLYNSAKGVVAIDWSNGAMRSANGTQNYNFIDNIFHQSASFVNSGRIFGEYIQSSSTNSGTYTYGAPSVNNSNISLWLSGSAATSLTCSVSSATANMPVGAEFTIMTSNAITSLNLLTSPTIVGTALTSMTAGQAAVYKKVNSNTLFRTR